MSAPITASEFREREAAHMSEADLQGRVERIARAQGYLAYHTYDSRRSSPGFPDLVLLHPRTGHLLFRELKTMRGRLTAPQRVWLTALTGAGFDADIWRPIDLLDDTIAHTLTPRTPS